MLLVPVNTWVKFCKELKNAGESVFMLNHLSCGCGNYNEKKVYQCTI